MAQKISNGDFVIVQDFIGFVVREKEKTYVVTDGVKEREFIKKNVQLVVNAYALAHMTYVRIKGGTDAF